MGVKPMMMKQLVAWCMQLLRAFTFNWTVSINIMLGNLVDSPVDSPVGGVAVGVDNIDSAGHFLLTHLLVELMISDNSTSRVINVSAKLHEYGTMHFDDLMMSGNYSGFSAYCQSKLANVLFTRELARRLSGQYTNRILVYICYVLSFYHLNTVRSAI